MYNFEKRLIAIAYYLYDNDALGYWEAVNLMLYYFGWHHEIAEEHARDLIHLCEKKYLRGDKVTAFPNIWNSKYIFG